MPPKEIIKEFQNIYKDTYRDDINEDSALELAQNLLNLYRIVYKVPPDSGGSVLKRGWG